MHDHDSTPILEFAALAETVVSRTAGFLNGDTDKPWPLIHAAGVVGELHEVWQSTLSESEPPRDAYGYACFEYEIGDCIWELVALAMSLGIPTHAVMQRSELVDPWQDEALVAASRVLEHVKKLTRDAPLRKVDTMVVIENLAIVFRYLECLANRDVTLAAVNSKLCRRFPNGFSASESVNRHV